MERRWKLVAWVVLAVVTAACSSKPNCGPCAPPGLIEVSGLAAGATAVRVCLDEQCGEPKPLVAGMLTVSVDKAIYDASAITLEVLGGDRAIGSYTARLTLRPPSGENCDCGESALLAPGQNGSLIRKS